MAYDGPAPRRACPQRQQVARQSDARHKELDELTKGLEGAHPKKVRMRLFGTDDVLAGSEDRLDLYDRVQQEAPATTSEAKSASQSLAR